MFDEFTRNHVNCRTARDEAQRTIRIAAFGEFRRQVAVFDDLDVPLRDAEVAEFFERTGLGEHDRAHLRVFEVVEPEEERIHHRNERVVHLEVGEVFDPFALHAVERAGFAQCQQCAAVPVRRK
ncbi:MAG: hypothetical protein L6W00_08160 [Lentisphaeria bacterium]|nr:MAG: hypothetical protein L6W00_08160 [Lentisphaeria bacterium]